MRALSLQALSRLGLLALVVALPACDSNDDGDDPDGVFATAEANRGDWTFIETAGAVCRDGSPTGFGIRLADRRSDNLMIYLEGGGACFNSTTCQGNASSFGRADFTGRAATLNNGIFNTASSNPVGDWNAVYVPYCTGDVHGGSAPNATVPGVAGTQQFVGHQNIEKYLALLAPYLGDPDKVLLTGASAGGFGTLVNFPAVDEAFDGSQTYLLDDSGPIFYADNVLSPLLGGAFTALYNFPATVPGATTLFQPDGLQNIYSYLSTTYPDSRFALASHLEDQTIRFFFGFNPATGQPFAISGNDFSAGLRDLRGRLPSSWGTYYASGAAHTFIGGSEYTQASAGVALNTYVGNLVNGRVSNVDPAGTTRPALAAR